MTGLGLIFGLLTALCHSLAYLATRWFTVDRGRPGTQLLVLAHSMMGVAALSALPALWPRGLTLTADWLLPYSLLLMCFIVGQCCLILALRSIDASQVSPLLGLKVALLAVLAVVQGGTLTAGQWGAVTLAVASAWVLQGAGRGRLPWRGTALVLGACLGYALADTFIMHMIRALQQQTGDRGAVAIPLFAVVVVYSGVGVIAAALLPRLGCRQWRAWRDAVPYAAAWSGAMLTLYVAFAALGTVFTAILQSTRGLMSIGLGVMLSHWGWHHLEQKHGRGVVLRRLAATGLMCLAVWLYARDVTGEKPADVTAKQAISADAS